MRNHFADGFGKKYEILPWRHQFFNQTQVLERSKYSKTRSEIIKILIFHGIKQKDFNIYLFDTININVILLLLEFTYNIIMHNM